MSVRNVVLVGVVGMTAVTLTACSSGASKSSTSAAGSSSAGSSSSSPAPSGSGSASSGTSTAAQEYVSLTSAADADLTGFLAEPNTTPIAQVQAAASKLAGDYTPLLQGLQKTSWPSTAQAPIATLEAAIPGEQAVYQQCATQPTVAAVKAVLEQDQAAIAKRATASRAVRTVLGLPNPSPSGSAGGSAGGSASASATSSD